MVNGATDYTFQEECVDFLYEKTTTPAKQVITVKAPTGAGKTVILVKYVDEFLKNTPGQTAFIWLCPGKGNLEEQSKDRMEQMTPHIDARSLIYSMLSGFSAGSVTFINWELVTKKGNNVLKDSERKNLFEKIAEAHQDGVRFIVIIDEEHENNTSKANDIIAAFAPKHIIRVSATPQKVPHQEYYEIPEEDVIEAGLITRAIYVNEGVVDSRRIEDDYDVLLKLADDKRQEILAGYEMHKLDIRPLVLIQFPVGQPETIKAVEDKLASMGYTYDNGMVSIWMADSKINLDGITELNAAPAFLLMKQAVATGWDCPRAKILVKLREGGSERFQIQTIGRIRRMPERKHYGFPGVLDNCYIYTLDSEYKNDLLTALDKAYQVRRLFSKKMVRDFTITKQLRNMDAPGFNMKDERVLLAKIYDFFKDKYHLSKKMDDNKVALASAGYSFSSTIDKNVLQGMFKSVDDIVDATKSLSIQTKVNTHNHGIYMVHNVNELKTITKVPQQTMKNILQRLFRKGKNGKSTTQKFVALETNDFYAFIINNIAKLKQDFREIMATEARSFDALGVMPKESSFSIPESEIYKYGVVKKIKMLDKNAYEQYTNEFLTSEVRSTSERLFELYCENDPCVEWVYKNGDTGQQYFSVVYHEGLMGSQRLFYPDYIVKTTSGDIWIIETKGGMQGSSSKNIDLQVENKFKAFKEYAKQYGVKWGFVRDIDNDLFICNTEYTDDMRGDNWQPLEGIFSDEQK